MRLITIDQRRQSYINTCQSLLVTAAVHRDPYAYNYYRIGEEILSECDQNRAVILVTQRHIDYLLICQAMLSALAVNTKQPYCERALTAYCIGKAIFDEIREMAAA